MSSIIYTIFIFNLFLVSWIFLPFFPLSKSGKKFVSFVFLFDKPIAGYVDFSLLFCISFISV